MFVYLFTARYCVPLTCVTAGLQRSRFNNRTEERKRNESKKPMLLSGLRITGLRTSTGLERSQRERERRRRRRRRKGREERHKTR